MEEYQDVVLHTYQTVIDLAEKFCHLLWAFHR